MVGGIDAPIADLRTGAARHRPRPASSVPPASGGAHLELGEGVLERRHRLRRRAERPALASGKHSAVGAGPLERLQDHVHDDRQEQSHIERDGNDERGADFRHCSDDLLRLTLTCQCRDRLCP